ncbi:Galactose/methyl galactoside import ATP-binding protein MglA [bacterium HR40]|nr:Galactose/methyl galactoside import ATP-binding protein MglA [bacterium HR40]
MAEPRAISGNAAGAPPAAAAPVRLELRGVTKRFGAVLANDAVDLEVRAGEIHALLGENGAGKSTLVRIVYGVLQPDAGEIRFEGQPIVVDSPHTARRLGIGMVFQHFTLFEALSVVENVALGLEGRWTRQELAARIREMGQRYGLPLEPERAVHTLSAGERQRVEIVRALLQDPKLLMLDEPTSVLTPQEIERLFSTLRRLAAEGRSILYISHRLAEVTELCDRATILRGGRVVASCDPRRTGARELARLMVGRELPNPRRSGTPARHAPLLEVDSLSLEPTEAFGTPLRDISFTVGRGEIFGIGGVAGNGQKELFEALAGERTVGDAAICLGERPIGGLGPAARRRLGLCTLPEERLGHAAVGSFSLCENALLTGWQRRALQRCGIIRWRRTRAFARAIIDRFAVRCSGPDAASSSLSGGNLQKFVVGRELLQDPLVLVVAQPTWGVDAAAAAAIHAALLQLADRGTAIVVISQDLDELLAITDRLALLHRGRLSAPLATREADIERIGLLMGGLHDLAEPA